MVRHATHIVALALGLAAAGCSDRPADFYVQGTGVVVETDAPFANHQEFPRRLEEVVSVALRYWGGAWRDLEGATITFSGSQYVACGGHERALGCHQGNEMRISTIDPGLGTVHCVEQTVLVHEIGHAILGDQLHEDPRWMQLEPVRDELEGGDGYTPDGWVECAIAVSVWRHPLGRP
jgi:hypothetical protein